MRSFLILNLLLLTVSFGQNIKVSKDTLKFISDNFWPGRQVSDSIMVFNKGDHQLRISSIETYKWSALDIILKHNNLIMGTGQTLAGSNIFPIDIIPNDSVKLIIIFTGRISKTSINPLNYRDSLFLYNNSLNRKKYSQLTLTNYPVAVEKEIALPEIYSLSQNYPNPFNPVTTINYSIPATGFVTIKIFDLLGKEVAKIVNQEKAAGKHQIEFNAENLSSGIYFYSIRCGDYIQLKKMILLK